MINKRLDEVPRDGLRVPDRRQPVGGAVFTPEPGWDEGKPDRLCPQRGGVRGNAGGDDREGEGGEDGDPYVVKREQKDNNEDFLEKHFTFMLTCGKI